MQNAGRQRMSAYEGAAWDKLLTAERSKRRSVRTKATERVSAFAAKAATAATDGVRRIPGGETLTDGFDAVLRSALSGMAKAVFIPAIGSVSLERRVSRLRERHLDLLDRDPFIVLDLKDLDRRRPRQVTPLLNAATSAGASVAITGATVSTTVSGGTTATVAVGAIATDIATSLALLGRSVAQVAVHYGYDPREPEEEVFLMGVLSFSTAGSLGAKTTALSGLSKLVQQMMRQATWKQLEKDVTVKIIQKVFTSLGLNLTHGRLAQAVPVVGVVVAAGLSYDMQNRTLNDATRIYRARRLSDKYGLDFDEWVASAMEDDRDEFSTKQATDEEEIDIMDVVAEVSETDPER